MILQTKNVLIILCLILMCFVIGYSLTSTKVEAEKERIACKVYGYEKANELLKKDPVKYARLDRGGIKGEACESLRPTDHISHQNLNEAKL